MFVEPIVGISSKIFPIAGRTTKVFFKSLATALFSAIIGKVIFPSPFNSLTMQVIRIIGSMAFTTAALYFCISGVLEILKIRKKSKMIQKMNLIVEKLSKNERNNDLVENIKKMSVEKYGENIRDELEFLKDMYNLLLKIKNNFKDSSDKTETNLFLIYECGITQAEELEKDIKSKLSSSASTNRKESQALKDEIRLIESIQIDKYTKLIELLFQNIERSTPY